MQLFYVFFANDKYAEGMLKVVQRAGKVGRKKSSGGITIQLRTGSQKWTKVSVQLQKSQLKREREREKT